MLQYQNILTQQKTKWQLLNIFYYFSLFQSLLNKFLKTKEFFFNTSIKSLYIRIDIFLLFFVCMLSLYAKVNKINSSMLFGKISMLFDFFATI